MPLTLFLMGPVRLISGNGGDLTPRGQKTRGALALLGTAAAFRMTRARLQDKLWSDKESRQASDSLRQMLRELRGALGGKYEDALLTGPGWVGLNPECVTVDLTPVRLPSGELAEFAEDLDIADPEFEDWLRDTRMSQADAAEENATVYAIPAPQAAPPQRVKLIATEVQGTDENCQVMTAMTIAEAVARAAELIPADSVSNALVTQLSGPGMIVSGMGMRQGANLQMMISSRDLETTRQLWLQRFTAPADASAETIQHITTSMTVGLIEASHKITDSEPVVFPLWDVFSYSHDRLMNADRMLSRNPEAEGSTMNLALRAYLRYTMIIERQSRSPEQLIDEAEGFVSRAMAASPLDPTTLATAALFRSWRGDTAGALERAQLACRVAPQHDLAHLALSQALSDAGKNRESLSAVLRVADGPIAVMGQASWHLRRMVAYARLGRFSKAEDSAAAAQALAPDNRPSLRFLAALRWKRGDEAGAADALQKLREIEPDFSLRLMESPEYPVTTLRNLNLLGVTRSGL